MVYVIKMSFIWDIFLNKEVEVVFFRWGVRLVVLVVFNVRWRSNSSVVEFDN